MPRVLLAAALAAAASGCTITATNISSDDVPTNSCDSDSDCRNGSCIKSLCQTSNGQLESLLIEVTPTADSTLPHIPFLKRLEQVPTSGGEQSLSLVRAAKVTGHLNAPQNSTCEPTFFPPILPRNDEDSTPERKALPGSSDHLTYPATVTLTPRDALLGLPTQAYLFDATQFKTTPSVGIFYEFELLVPAGDYDVYVAPPVDQEEVCPVPPQLLRGQPISPDTVLEFQAATAGVVPLVVHFPEASGVLDDWVADIIEPIGGKPISVARVLKNPVHSPGKSLEYSLRLAYSVVDVKSPAGEPSDLATDLVRLRPPAGLVAPTVFLDRAGLGLFGENDGSDSVVLDGFTQFPAAVQVEAQMIALDDGQPVAGHVSLVSSEIFGVDQGVFASFQTDIAVNESGLFSLAVPPGKYRVYAVPPLSSEQDGPSLSAYETTWEIGLDVPFQAGKVLELPSLAEVRGQSSLKGAEVQILASPQSTLPFDQAFGAAKFLPRAVPGLVDRAGQFAVKADPGRFDISVRPAESSGFAWLVRPGFEVTAGNPDQDLGRLSSLWPSVVQGTATVGTTPVTSALIRAYAYLDKDLVYTRDPNLARSIIQVAETRTDEAGGFRLLVPSSIAGAR